MIQKKINNKVVGLLQSEQVDDDDDKKTSCVPRFTKIEEKAKVLARKIFGHKDATEENHDLLSNTPTRIMTVQQSITELSYSMMRAISDRNIIRTHVTLIASTATATELLTFAVSRISRPQASQAQRVAAYRHGKEMKVSLWRSTSVTSAIACLIEQRSANEERLGAVAMSTAELNGFLTDVLATMDRKGFDVGRG